MTIDSNFVYFCIFIALPLSRCIEFFPIISFFFIRKTYFSFLRWVRDVVFLPTFPIVALRKIHLVQGENGGRKSTQQKSATISQWYNLSKFNEIMNHSGHTQIHKVRRRRRGKKVSRRKLYISSHWKKRMEQVMWITKSRIFPPFLPSSSMFSRYGSCSRLLNQKENCLHEVTSKQKRGKVIHQRKKKWVSTSEWNGGRQNMFKEFWRYDSQCQYKLSTNFYVYTCTTVESHP